MNPNLRDFLRAVRETGPDNYVEVTKPLDPYLEIGIIQHKLAAEGRNPVIYCPEIKGSALPLMTNMFGSFDLLAWGLGCDPRSMTRAEIYDVLRKKLAQREDPVWVDEEDAPVKEKKFIGDAVMAWWGATTSQEDDAERATRAALDIVDRVTTLGEQEGIDDLAARAGVMTGEASVGPGGNEKGLLLGDLVNSASRLQSLAAPGSVFVGSRTADLIASALEVVSEGSHLVKGKETPLEAFRVGRVLGSDYRPDRDVIEPPFVGRDAELRILKDNLQAVDRDKRARLVSLVGHAGMPLARVSSMSCETTTVTSGSASRVRSQRRSSAVRSVCSGTMTFE